MQAIRDLPFSTSILPCYGKGYLAKDVPIEEKKWAPTTIKYHRAIAYPNKSYNTMEMQFDTNYFKRKVHDGWKIRPGYPGSIEIFPPEYVGQHVVLHKHMLAEEPRRDYFEKEDREVFIFEQTSGQDNEFFDNLVGCLAGLCRLGANFKQQKSVPKKSINMQEYIDKQRDT